MLGETGSLSALVWIHVWQIAIVGVLIGGINCFVGRRWPHLAYALWLVLLAKCFVPPVGSWPVVLIARWTPDAIWEVTATDRDSSSAAVQADTRTATNMVFSPARSEGAIAPDEKKPEGDAIPQDGDTLIGRLLSAAAIAAPFLWLGGSVLLCGIAIGRGSEVGRRLRRTSRPMPPELQEMVDRIAKRFGLRSGFEVLRTSADMGPMVVGVWPMRVYVPDLLIEWMCSQQLEAMLTHELAHVRRCDTWVASLQFLAQTIWWFHPVVWWMNRELVRQRERCCDEEVVAVLNGNRSDYARCLVDVLEAKQRLEPLWSYPAVRPVELTHRRLEEIMKRKNMIHVRAPRWCWLVAAGAAITVLPGGVSQSAAETKATTEAGKDSKKSEAAAASKSANADASVSREPESSRTSRSPALLQYGDGKADGKKSIGGSGEMIRFELPEGVDKISGIKIHGSRYGLPDAPNEDFEIMFVSEDFSEILHTESAPYKLFKRSKEVWVRVNFKEPVELPPKFWIALNFNAQQTKGVYVSYDTSTKGKNSRVGLPGGDAEPKETEFKGDWMVQVILK